MAKPSAKRNTNGLGSIRLRPDGRWEARYSAGYNPQTGKPTQKSVYGKTQKQVAQKLKRILADLDSGEYINPTLMTLAKWLDIWLAEYLIGVKESTTLSYTQHVKNHITPALGTIKLQDLSGMHIQSFYNLLSRKKRLSPKTVKNIHSVLHSALDQAVNLSIIRSNPTNTCILPRIIQTEIEPLDTPDIEKFLSAIDGHQYEMLFILALFTGMRQSEIIGLQWDCVDFEKGTISINKQLVRSRGANSSIMTTLKNDKPRTITPAPSIMAKLKKYKVQQSTTRLALGGAWDDPEFKNLVFLNSNGMHVAHTTILRSFKRAVANAGISDRRFHDLRHTYAVSSIRSGDDIKTVQGNLGHATAAFTLDKYGHLTETMRKDSADRMEQYIATLNKS